MIIPDFSITFTSTDNINEAHYLAAVLNSSISRLIISSYTIETEISTHILKYVCIPKFNPNNLLHLKLSKLSKNAHELAKKIYEEKREDLKEDLKQIEEEIDKIVAQLYGITDEELREIKKCLKILREGEMEEEAAEEEIFMPKMESIRITLDPLLIEENKQQKIKIKITNNLKDTIRDIDVKVLLGKKSIFKGKVSKVKSEEQKELSFITPSFKRGQYNLQILLKYKQKRKVNSLKVRKILFVKPVEPKRETKSALDEELEKLLE